MMQGPLADWVSPSSAIRVFSRTPTTSEKLEVSRTFMTNRVFSCELVRPSTGGCIPSLSPVCPHFSSRVLPSPAAAIWKCSSVTVRAEFSKSGFPPAGQQRLNGRQGAQSLHVTPANETQHASPPPYHQDGGVMLGSLGNRNRRRADSNWNPYK